MTEFALPIIVAGDGSLQVYPTADIACQAVEVYDIDLYEVFDSSGRRFAFSAAGLRVQIVERTGLPPDPAGLERRVRAHIESVGAERWGIAEMDAASLPFLVGSCSDSRPAFGGGERGSKAVLCRAGGEPAPNRR